MLRYHETQPPKVLPHHRRPCLMQHKTNPEAVFVNAQQARDQSRPTRPTFLSALSTFALVFVILAFGILDGKNGRYARYTLYTPRLPIQVKQEKIKCATLQLAFPFLPSFPLSPSSSSFIVVQQRSTAHHMHEACCSMFIRQFSM